LHAVHLYVVLHKALVEDGGGWEAHSVVVIVRDETSAGKVDVGHFGLGCFPPGSRGGGRGHEGAVGWHAIRGENGTLEGLHVRLSPLDNRVSTFQYVSPTLLEGLECDFEVVTAEQLGLFVR